MAPEFGAWTAIQPVLAHPSVFDIASKYYYLAPEQKLTLEGDEYSGPTTTVVTVLSGVDEDPLNPDTVKRMLRSFESADDVFCSDFMSTVLVQRPFVRGNVNNTCSIVDIDDKKVQLIDIPVPDGKQVANGPYFLRDRALHQAWRLYPDTADAFFAPLQPDPEGSDSYTWLGVSGIFGPTLAIAVPSRLYFKSDKLKPLNGMRLVIKDNYDIKGVHTTLSNKSFLKFHEPAIETAPAVQELINKGAVVVGKTKMTSFADREYPPSDWIDYHCPFNPRGDGYLIPDGSSTGTAAAVATYDWLDAGLGTDTSASLRMPAASQGIFGIRSSHGVVSMQGIAPIVTRFDVAGFMARDIHTMQRLATAMYPQPTWEETKFPKKLIYNPDWSESNNLPEAGKLFSQFVENLERFLGVERSVIDIEQEWTNDNPLRTGRSFEEEFLRTYERIHTTESYRYQSAWAKKYALKFGKAPYLPPALKNRWPYARTITDEQVKEAYSQVDGYRNWFQSKFLSSQNDEASSAIMVDRWTWSLGYRDTLRETPNAGRDYGFSQEFSASFAELPELVMCVGQYEYESQISQTKEFAPVAVSIIGSKGSERMLLKLAEQFLKFADIPTTVLTGPTSFPAPIHHVSPNWHL